MSNQIQGVIVAVVIGIASLIMYPILNATADQLQAALQPHCEANGDQFTKIYSDEATASAARYTPGTGVYGGSGVDITNAAGVCTVGATALPGTVAGTAYSNHGTAVGTVTIAGAVTFSTGAAWVTPPAALTRFNGLTDVVLSMLPVLMVVGFLSLGVIRGLQSNQGNLEGSIVNQVQTIVVLIAAVTVTPLLLTALGDAALASETGAWDVNSRFSGLLSLLFGFVPVLMILGLAGYIVVQTRSIISGRA